MKYRINEIFHSLQGEGFNQGREVVFIRLSGCNIHCSWCDTEYTIFTEYSVSEILDYISQWDCKSVIVTGGEPSIYDLTELFSQLKTKEYWIAIETNGTNDLGKYAEWLDYIALSPKSKTRQKLANEVRVVNDELSTQKLLAIEKEISADEYFVSPLEMNGEMNIQDTMELVGKLNQLSEKNWRISLQLHKLVGIR